MNQTFVEDKKLYYTCVKSIHFIKLLYIYYYITNINIFFTRKLVTLLYFDIHIISFILIKIIGNLNIGKGILLILKHCLDTEQSNLDELKVICHLPDDLTYVHNFIKYCTAIAINYSPSTYFYKLLSLYKIIFNI